MAEKHGYSYNPLYRVWFNMNSRCHNPEDKSYNNYGGRGIKVCKLWRRTNDGNFDSLRNFIQWAEPIYEKGLTLERVNNNKGYSPDNCEFATLIKNMANRRNTTVIKTGKYKNMPFADFYRLSKTKVPYNLARVRFIRGFSLKECISDKIFSQKGSVKIKNRGQSHGASKLTEKAVLEIRKLKAQGLHNSEIAKMYSISRSTVWKIHKGLMWQWLK